MAGGTWDKITVNSVNKNTIFVQKKMYIVSHQTVWWTLVPPRRCAVHIVYFVCLSSGSGMYICTYHLHVSTLRQPSTLKRGPERSPFYTSLRGLIFLRLGRRPHYVQSVHSTWRLSRRSPLRPAKGTRTVPFFNQPRGASYLVDLA